MALRVGHLLDLPQEIVGLGLVSGLQKIIHHALHHRRQLALDIFFDNVEGFVGLFFGKTGFFGELVDQFVHIWLELRLDAKAVGAIRLERFALIRRLIKRIDIENQNAWTS